MCITFICHRQTWWWCFLCVRRQKDGWCGCNSSVKGLLAALLERHAQLWWENNTSMHHLHLKGTIYHRKGGSGTKLFSVYWFLSPVYVPVCAAHQQGLLYIHWGIGWGTIHAPWSFLQDVWGRQAYLTRHYEVDMLLACLGNKRLDMSWKWYR